MQFVLLQLPQQSKKLVYTYAWLVCNLLKLYCALCLQSVGFAYQYIVQQASLGRAGLERLPTGLAWAAFQTVEGKPNQGPSLYATYVRQHYERKFISIVPKFSCEAFLLSKSEQISKYIILISNKELRIFAPNIHKSYILLLFKSG